jgi:hypothetical protein
MPNDVAARGVSDRRKLKHPAGEHRRDCHGVRVVVVANGDQVGECEVG